MAERIKTITVPFNFDNPAELANNTTTLIGNNTIYIPENNANTPVVIRYAGLFLSHADASTATGTQLAEYTANVTLQGAAVSHFRELGDLTNTAENQAGVLGPIDHTAHFAANFGTVQSKDCIVEALFSRNIGTGVGTRAVYAWMDITYTYDDTQPTHIKTICFPVSNISGALATTANNVIGTVPVLTGGGSPMLCETSPVIRQMWMVFKGNNGNAAVTDHNLTVGVGGASQALPTVECALQTGTYHTFLYNANTVNTLAEFSPRAWGSLATRWHNLVSELWITYEFDAANTTRALNYVEQGLEFDSPLPGTTSANSTIIARSLMIPEPGLIIPIRQALEMRGAAPATGTWQVKVGSQSNYTGYAFVGGQVAGMFIMQHRFDTGGSGGNGLTLTNGENSYNVAIYRSTAQQIWNLSGKAQFLYQSNVAPSGIGSHNRVVRSLALPMRLTAAVSNVQNSSISNIGSDYYLNTMGLDLYAYTTAATQGISIKARELPGESAEGWNTLYTDLYINDAELTFSLTTVRARSAFKRHAGDLDATRMNANTARPIEYTFTTAAQLGAQWFATISNITYDWEGEIINSRGGNVTIYLVRNDTGERMYRGYRTGNGTYTIAVHTPGVVMYADAYESNVSLGRSNTSTVS